MKEISKISKLLFEPGYKTNFECLILNYLVSIKYTFDNFIQTNIAMQTAHEHLMKKR